MDLIKALRRSMKGDKHKAQSPSIGSKSAVAIVPPKKVGPPPPPAPLLLTPLSRCLLSLRYHAVLRDTAAVRGGVTRR